MGEKYTPVKGDRVRVVVEGEVEWVTHYADGVFDLDGGAVGIHPHHKNVVSIEKVEPPVEVFKPGDVVRHKAQGSVRALASDGYVRLDGEPGKFYWYNALSGPERSLRPAVSYRLEDFTSKNFELVDLSK
jgi:hypothetical protein